MVKSIMKPPTCLANTDKVLWDSEDGMCSVFVNECESIGIIAGGRVTVMPARDWMNSLDETERLRAALGQARARISKLEGYIVDNVIEGKMK